jgi:copper(I)-binding protein
MRMKRCVTVVFVAAVPALKALAHDFHAGAIGIDHARAAPAAAGQKEEPAFMTLTNSSGKNDVLIGATCTVATSVELRSAVPAESGTRSRTLESIPIPANSTLEFKAQGYHLALMSVGYSFAAGDRIAATLRFASGLEVPVEFQVQEEGAAEARAEAELKAEVNQK